MMITQEKKFKIDNNSSYLKFRLHNIRIKRNVIFMTHVIKESIEGKTGDTSFKAQHHITLEYRMRRKLTRSDYLSQGCMSLWISKHKCTAWEMIWRRISNILSIWLQWHKFLRNVNRQINEIGQVVISNSLAHTTFTQ